MEETKTETNFFGIQTKMFEYHNNQLLKTGIITEDGLINSNFTSKRRQHIFRSKPFRRQEQMEDDVFIKKQRTIIIDSKIVRIMKSRNIMTFNEIMIEISKDIDFNIDNKIIKKRIEALIERDYIERTENLNEFSYKA